MDNINKRNVDEGSTSRYIQQRIPDPNGVPSKQVSKISMMPEQGIINALITITQTVKTMTKSFASGVITSLSPSNVTQIISEPHPTSEKADYGKIVVQETSGGHVIIMDDTDGNKRIIGQHANGSYDALLDAGDAVNKTTRDSYTFVKKNMLVHVGKDFVEIVSGDSKIQILGSRIDNISGSLTENIGGDKSIKVGGSHVFHANGDMSENASGSAGSQCGGDRDEVTGGNLTITVAGTCNINVTGECNLKAATVDIDGGGHLNGIVTGDCLCALTGKPHIQYSSTVKGSI